MYSIRMIARTVIAIVILAVGPIPAAHAAGSVATPKSTGPVWIQRCEPAKDKKSVSYCEVFQELLFQKKGEKQAQRLAEIAVGFPPEKKGAARGVIIVPLGVLLETPFKIQIGEKGNPFIFHPRFCSYDGCISYIDLGQDQLQQMKAADQMTLMLQMASGKPLSIVMSLKGFGPALDKLKR